MSVHRKNLLTIFNHALQSVNGCSRVQAVLEQDKPEGKVAVIAIGKAAVAMAKGAQAVLGEQIIDGLIITKHGYADKTFLPVIEAGHPVPDDSSLRAGHELLALLERLAEDVQLLLLVSGGASALVEVLPAGLDGGDLRRVNTWLLASGLDIGRVNRVRKAISAIKGGRLTRYFGERPCLCLLLSDVIADDPAVIGSGLVAPTSELPTGLADIPLPGWIQAFTELAEPQPTASDACFRHIRSLIIANNRLACEAAAARAAMLGYDVFLHPEPFCCDADSTGQRLANSVLAANPILHIWGGETVVNLPATPGRGGRNQQLALSAATQLAGHADCYLLAAGTDGSDGPTEDAGGLVDGETVARGEQEGLHARDCLRGFAAGDFLEASGDLLTTGPTGTNVMDIVLGLKTG